MAAAKRGRRRRQTSNLQFIRAVRIIDDAKRAAICHRDLSGRHDEANLGCTLISERVARKGLYRVGYAQRQRYDVAAAAICCAQGELHRRQIDKAKMGGARFDANLRLRGGDDNVRVGAGWLRKGDDKRRKRR